MTRLLTRIERLLATGLAAAECTALVAAPWSPTAGLFLITLLLVPMTLGLVAAIRALPTATVVWLARATRRLFRDSVPALVCLELGFSLASTAGLMAWCNRRVIDAPFGRTALVCDGCSFAASIAGTMLMRRALRNAVIPPWLKTVSWPRAGGALLLAIGGACGAWDAAGLPQDYRVLHGLLLVVTATTFSTGFSLLCDSPRRARRLLEIAAAVLLAMLLLQASGSARGDALYSSIARSRSPHERVLSFARSLLDRDGDGFSAALGGGDCDDRDPSAYPLSTEGRDCLGWIDHSPRELTPLTRSLSVEIARRQPRIILLLTIDTFRCGFGSSDRSELRDVCPSLSALAREGSARLDAHSDYPVTARAMTILNTGDLHSNPAVPKVRTFYLASALHSLGYANEVIVTHPNIIADAGVKASFDEIDDSLVAVAREPSASTADEVSAHALARIEHAAAPLFLWAHYLDPHAPYVETPGERTHVSELDGYQAEVRRTDASIGRLADSLRARADADDILVILTADHGEEFGEHGGANHGKSLHEEATRVPMIVWSAGADHRAYGRGSLPSRTEEVAPFIMSLVGGGPFTSRGSTYLRTRPPGDAQIALVAGGWKLIYHQTLNYSELYHLAVDPAEIDDRADAEPGRVTKMGERLGGFFSPVQKPAAPLTADRPAGAPAG